MEQADYESYITHGREERNLEYKESISWGDSTVRNKLTKSILARANLRDGGVIVIGVQQEGDNFNPKGMTQADFQSFSHDKISEYVAEYADPFVEITVSLVEYNGGSYVITQVKEFEELPVLCKKDGMENLRRGALFIRSRRKPETVQVPSQTEMREILELAIDKGVKKQLEHLGSLGLLSREQISPEEASRRALQEQRGGL